MDAIEEKMRAAALYTKEERVNMMKKAKTAVAKLETKVNKFLVQVEKLEAKNEATLAGIGAGPSNQFKLLDAELNIFETEQAGAYDDVIAALRGMINNLKAKNRNVARDDGFIAALKLSVDTLKQVSMLPQPQDDEGNELEMEELVQIKAAVALATNRFYRVYKPDVEEKKPAEKVALKVKVKKGTTALPAGTNPSPDSVIKKEPGLPGKAKSMDEASQSSLAPPTPTHAAKPNAPARKRRPTPDDDQLSSKKQKLDTPARGRSLVSPRFGSALWGTQAPAKGTGPRAVFGTADPGSWEFPDNLNADYTAADK